MPKRKYYGYYNGRRQRRGRYGGYAAFAHVIAIALLLLLGIIVTQPVASIVVILSIAIIIGAVKARRRPRSIPSAPAPLPYVHRHDESIRAGLPTSDVHLQVPSNFTRDSEGKWVSFVPQQPQKSEALLHPGTGPRLPQAQHISPVGEAAYQARVKNRQYKKVGGFWVPNMPGLAPLPCGHEERVENIYLGATGKRNCRICSGGTDEAYLARCEMFKNADKS
jgi:hypothetical protein